VRKWVCSNNSRQRIMAGQTIPNTLADEARADGLHDFGPLGPRKEGERNTAFTGSVAPSRSINAWDEDQALNAVFGIVPPAPSIRSILDGLADNADPVPLPQTVTGHRYNVKRVAFVGGAAEGKSGSTIASQCNLNGSVLQVDFNHHGFLSRLKAGPAAPEINVGYIWSAATVNDPASKTPPGDVIFGEGGGGVRLKVYQQVSGSTLFPGGNPYTANGPPTQNFISAYDVELSGITKKVSFGRRVKDIVTIKFTDPPTKRSVTISDSKGQNSPAQLNGFITKLLANLGSQKAKFELSTKWQQKRSGDWLQALHAAILKTMTFDEPLPPGFHTFFVSHDRIAIAYALSMGVSCLYFAGDSVYVFDNRPVDPGAAAARCTAGLAIMQARVGANNPKPDALGQWFFGYDVGGRHFNGMSDARDDKLAEFYANVETACNELRVARTLDDFEAHLKDAFSNAMLATFLEKSFPDRETILLETQSRDDVCTRYKAFATLDSLYKQHAGGQTIPGSFYDQFKRTMVYKTLMEWRIEPASSVPSRLIAFIRQDQAEQDTRDSFAFLPFIQNSDRSDMKEYIAETCQTILPTLTPERLLGMGARTQSRIARATLGITTILKQAHIYLKSTEVPDDAMLALAAEFTAVANIPSVPSIAGDAPGLVVNRMTLDSVAESKMSKQSISDSAPDEDLAIGGKQVGGWALDSRLKLGTELDFDQCTDPLLYAMVDYAIELGVGAAAEDIQRGILAREAELFPAAAGGAIRRRALYGGATQTMTMTEPVATTPVDTKPADIINISAGLLASGRIVRDSYKLSGAPADVIAYYAKTQALLSALTEVTPTWDIARAVHALTSRSAYMTGADFVTAFGMRESEAEVMRMQFSAMEENPPIQRPTEPAKDLVAAKEALTKLWQGLPPTTGATAESIRTSAESTMRKVAERYGTSGPAFPGTGIPLTPDAPKLTPEEVRERRVAILTRKAAPPPTGARRRTRRRTRVTTPS
jgi:hypothetical protein